MKVARDLLGLTRLVRLRISWINMRENLKLHSDGLQRCSLSIAQSLLRSKAENPSNPAGVAYE
jgi:hypothetical protein